MGWTFLTNVIDKTPTTTGAWVDIDVSANVPSGTKAVLLKIVNTSTTGYSYGIRPTGSSITRTGYITSDLAVSWDIAIVKLDSYYKFQAYIGNTAIKIYLWGYTDEDICFVNPYDKSTTTTNAWVDVSNTELPNGSKGAIYERVNNQSGYRNFGLRPKGSTADIEPKINNQSHAWALIGIDTNKYSQQYITDTLCDLYLWGHAGSDFVSFTDPYNITPTTTGSYVTIDLSSYIPDGAYGICGLIVNTSAVYSYSGDIRKYGSSDNHSAYSYIYSVCGRFFIVGCSSDRKVNIYIDNTAVKIYLWGYFKLPVITATFTETITLSDVTLKGTSKTFTETTSLSDVISKGTSKAFTETIALSDITLKQVTKLLIDTTYLSDVILKTTTRTFTEMFSLSDVVSKQAIKEFAETISLSDIITYLKLKLKELTETITLSDVISKQTTKMFTEEISLSDILSKKSMKMFIESIGLSDIISKQSIKLFTETISLSDIISKKSIKTFTETISLSEIFSKLPIKTFIESISLTDKISKQTIRTFIEQITLIDKFYRLLPPIEFVETIYLTDKVFRVAPIQRVPITPTRIISPIRTKKPDRIERIT
jgi:hypothetical protein